MCWTLVLGMAVAIGTFLEVCMGLIIGVLFEILMGSFIVIGFVFVLGMAILVGAIILVHDFLVGMTSAFYRVYLQRLFRAD